MIKIITVYNTLNPGSMLQATALYQCIEKKYPNTVCFYKTNARHPLLGGIKLALKLLKKLKFKNAIKQLIMPMQYHKLIKKYKINSNKEQNDIYVLGSDEIWNISRKQTINNKIFWGEGLNKNRCISYAPSINNTKIDEFVKYSFIDDSLKNIYSISVRDQYSKEVLTNLSNRKIEIVCDPTFFITKEKYKNLEEKINIDNYILVYGAPSRFTETQKKKIIDFAKKNNKKLISYYFSNDWCDEIVYGSPYKFLSLISNADYIFTNTFHGTVFSIIYNKKFISFDNNNQKVKEILEQFNLKQNDLSNLDFNSIFNGNYNYTEINKKIEELRNKSEEYLFNNIERLINKQ